MICSDARTNNLLLSNSNQIRVSIYELQLETRDLRIVIMASPSFEKGKCMQALIPGTHFEN